ncbi:hypothetical protein M427DRAFT_56489 [Gonapodya prolifera JEL478]|uniref:Uncharacterized protein n=1 Tax=Gonapodya prolifera (strain JEL478) TaxID=1344416 RepID=A0A139AG24_GONPJ|nr:hypothetical protein M427DRAFT_56489 [Gonapodya prolifera JEL478]|eukprot:KXS15649.1 hypothetical protein M427DRAFT_56489 [Gonapodya prolifera JEL478]
MACLPGNPAPCYRVPRVYLTRQSSYRSDTSLFRKAGTVPPDTSLDDLKLYFRWRLVYRCSDSLGPTLREPAASFDRVLQGRTGMQENLPLVPTRS